MWERIVKTLFFLLTGACISYCQTISCKLEYDSIRQLKDESYSVLDDRDVGISYRILRSKKLAEKALAFGYRTIELKNCEEYSIIIDRLIELEMMLGNYSSAEQIALMRINTEYPEFEDINKSIKIAPKDLTILTVISNAKKDNTTFYEKVRRYNGIPSICEFSPYSVIISTLLSQAKFLNDQYGKAYCLRFLEHSNLLLNEEYEPDRPIWEEIHDLLIEALHTKYSYQELLTLYEESKIIEDTSWVMKFAHGSDYRSRYYIYIDNTRLYFQIIINQENNKIESMDPTIAQAFKNKSNFYKKLKQYAHSE